MRTAQWATRLLFVFAVAAGSSGCAFQIAALNPRPNVDLPRSTKSLALQLDDSIKEDFITQPQNGIFGGQFFGFRSSLTEGFRAAFGESFKTSDGGQADYTLSIVELEPTFIPTAVAVTQYGPGPAAASAQLRYKARLLDAAGNVVARSNGTVRAKSSFMMRNDAKSSVSQAMETLYEKLATELVSQIATPAVATK